MDKRFLSALIIMISIFGLFAFILPSYGKITALRQAIEERELALAEKRSLIEKISSLADQLDSGKSSIDKLTLLAPQNKSLPELISAIESAGSQSGLVVSEIKFSEPPTLEGDYERIGADIRMTGSYLSAMAFLKTLEQNIRLADVGSINISELPGGGSNNLSISVKFDSYYLKK